MKLPTVDKFFFCLPLDVGAFVLAGLSIASSVGIVTLVTVLLSRYIAFYATLNETDQHFFRMLLITFVIVYVVYVLYFTIVFVASIMLIVGTRRRDHNQLLLFIILMAVGVIVCFIQIIQLNLLFLVPSLLGAVCSIYFFICVYSLYKNFKNQREPKEKNEYPENGQQEYENVVLRTRT